MRFILILLSVFFSFQSNSQVYNWSNGGGNPLRNGLANVPGPLSDSIKWKAISPGFFGMPIYIEGEKLITMRFLSTENAPMECYNLNTGALLWKKDITNSAGRSLPVGFRDNRIYAVRLTETNADSLFALDPTNGNIVWKSNQLVSASITASVNFTSNGDLFIECPNGSQQSICRINRNNGEKIWKTGINSMVDGYAEVTVYQNTGYLIEKINNQAHVSAFDLTSGQRKYSFVLTETNPGGALPQAPVMVGLNGTIFVHKQEDNISAISDNGQLLTKLWETKISGNAPFSHMCTGPDSTIYIPSKGKIMRLNPKNGFIIDSSGLICQTPELFRMRASASSNGIIYVTNGESNVYAFNQRLQPLWTDEIPAVNISGVGLGSNGLAAVAGAGIIKVYTFVNTTGLLEEKEAKDVELFPNPANQSIKIRTGKNQTGKDFSLMDFVGRIVAKGKCTSELVEIDLSNFKPGIYLFHFDSTQKPIRFTKI